MDVEDRGSNEEYAAEKPINYTGLIPIFLLLIVIIARISYEFYKSKRQKTRSTPERRGLYVGARPRQSSYGQPEPTIYVSPANLPPPPKYEAMAPPSYEEVVGIHYPQFQQPITTPIVAALAQNPDCRTHVINPNSNVTDICNNEPPTVITVNANERRTSVTVAAS